MPQANLSTGYRTGQRQKMKSEKGSLVRNCIKVELCIAHPGANAGWDLAYETVSVHTEAWLPVVSNGESGMLSSFFPPSKLCILQNPKYIPASVEAFPFPSALVLVGLPRQFMCMSLL